MTFAAPTDSQQRSLHRRFIEDGAVHIPQGLDAHWMAEALRDFEWSLERPSGTVAEYAKTEGGRFYVDTAHPDAPKVYEPLLRGSGLGDLLAHLWGSRHVWFAFEQIFYKEGGVTRSQRTGWHQDSSYLSFSGDHIAVVWITFDALPRESALEFVRGSHHGPLYEQRAAKVPTGRPTVPHIEADRSRFDILSWAVEPGDLLVFHPAILHGGAGTQAGMRRRTVSLRFIGDDATFERRPSTHDTPPQFLELNERLKDGDPFRHPAFLQLR